ncbi:MAG TPA: hypothetical protein VEB19_17950 [Gemmatimonadaceae bacterium]|nr:hypothetical protein [Gemmatimonadaceae bacterium]
MRRTLIWIIGALSLTLLGAACAPAPPPAESAVTAPRPVRRSNTLITRDELQQSTARDALGAIQTLRPDWLRGRGATSFDAGVPEVVVYLDGARVGTREVLRQFATMHIKEIRYLGATEATQKWGTDHSGGVIEIVTR